MVIPVICGPTAAGKSALAMALAERTPLAIISADSRQLYRGFDIGTAKPTVTERALVPHFGIDVAEPTERYSAARWADAAVSWIAESRARGLAPVIVGGTGFYIRALTAPLFEEPALDDERRLALQRELMPHGTEELRRWCRQLDPERAHLGKAQLVRAIEVALLTGVPISEWHRRTARPARLRARYLVVDPGAPLRERVADRARAMFDDGWLDEVVALDARVPQGAPAWNASGYRAVREVVRGRLSPAAALERVTIDTRQYAKRQRTWFRHQLEGEDVTRIDPFAPNAIDQLLQWWYRSAECRVPGAE